MLLCIERHNGPLPKIHHAQAALACRSQWCLAAKIQFNCGQQPDGPITTRLFSFFFWWCRFSLVEACVQIYCREIDGSEEGSLHGGLARYEETGRTSSRTLQTFPWD